VRPIHEQAARGFARAGTGEYEAGRPGYPAEAVRWLADALGLRPGRRVLDLAAGTGKLTRLLVPTGADVVAVEPVREMRAGLPDAVEALDGTAQAIPLGDGTVDAVTIAQALHWFAGDDAFAEIHRVLRPAGRLGLIWNAMDETVPWVGAVAGVVHARAGDAPRYATSPWRERLEATGRFGPLHEATFRQAPEMDRERLAARVTSISYISALGDAERAEVLAEVMRIVADLPERFPLPYRIDAFWAQAR